MKINIQTKYLHIYIDGGDYEFVLSAFDREIHLLIEPNNNGTVWPDYNDN